MFLSRFFTVHILLLGLIIALSQPTVSAAKAVGPDFAALAKKVNPTVVNIRTAKNIKPKQRLHHPQQRNPFGNNLFDDFFFFSKSLSLNIVIRCAWAEPPP